MDNKKKEKLVAIILTALISLATTITACIFEVTPEAQTQPADCAFKSVVEFV